MTDKKNHLRRDGDELDFSVPKKPKATLLEKAQAQKEARLVLEKVDYNSRATRGEMYKKMQQDEEILDKDLYDYASPVSRGIALLLDLAFYFGLYKAAIFLAPLEIKLVNFGLDKYKLQMDLPLSLQFPVFMGASLIALIFFMVLVPVSFFNTSFGKKCTGLRVRSTGCYTVTLSQAFKREIILKPLSMAVLAGFIMPFFNEHKQSLHDKMADTFVVKD